MKKALVLILSFVFWGCTNSEAPHAGEEVSSSESLTVKSNPVALPSWFPSGQEIQKAPMETRQSWEDLFSLEIFQQGEADEQMITRPHLIFDDRGFPIVLWEEENTFSTHMDNRQIMVRYNNLALTRWSGTSWVQMDGKTSGGELVTRFGREQYPSYWKNVAEVQIESVKAQQMRDFAARIADKKVVTVMDYRRLGSHWVDDRLVLLWKAPGGIFVTQWHEGQWRRMDQKTPGTELAVVFRTENEAVMDSIRFKFAFDTERNPLIVWREPLESLRGGFHEAKDHVQEDGIFFIKFNGNAWTNADGETPGAELVFQQKLIEYVLPSLFFDPEGNLILAWIAGDTLVDTGKKDQKSKLLVTRWDKEKWRNASGEAGVDEFKVSEGMIYYENFGVYYTEEGNMIVEYESYIPKPFEKEKNSFVWDETTNTWVRFTVVDEDGNEIP